jgi:hypothetical protein
VSREEDDAVALVRVYCGLVSADQAESQVGSELWLTVAVVDDAGRLLDIDEVSDDAAGYAELSALLAQRSGGQSVVAVAADSDDHVVTQLLAAAGRNLAYTDDDSADDYAERFADDESPEEIESNPASRRAVGLARALQAGVLSAVSQSTPRDMLGLKPLLAAHGAVVAGRQGTAATLREVLRELYPAALRAYPDPAEPIPLAVLDALPEPGILGGGTNGRNRDAQVVAELAKTGVADAPTLTEAITALRVAIAETPRRTGVTRALTTAAAETIRHSVAAVRANDAAAGALVTVLSERMTGGTGRRSASRQRPATPLNPAPTPLRAVRDTPAKPAQPAAAAPPPRQPSQPELPARVNEPAAARAVGGRRRAQTQSMPVVQPAARSAGPAANPPVNPAVNPAANAPTVPQHPQPERAPQAPYAPSAPAPAPYAPAAQAAHAAMQALPMPLQPPHPQHQPAPQQPALPQQPMRQGPVHQGPPPPTPVAPLPVAPPPIAPPPVAPQPVVPPMAPAAALTPELTGPALPPPPPGIAPLLPTRTPPKSHAAPEPPESPVGAGFGPGAHDVLGGRQFSAPPATPAKPVPTMRTPDGLPTLAPSPVPPAPFDDPLLDSGLSSLTTSSGGFDVLNGLREPTPPVLDQLDPAPSRPSWSLASDTSSGSTYPLNAEDPLRSGTTERRRITAIPRLSDLPREPEPRRDATSDLTAGLAGGGLASGLSGALPRREPTGEMPTLSSGLPRRSAHGRDETRDVPSGSGFEPRGSRGLDPLSAPSGGFDALTTSSGSHSLREPTGGFEPLSSSGSHSAREASGFERLEQRSVELPRQRESRVPPPWQADDLPSEPPGLRLVEPAPRADPALSNSGEYSDELSGEFRFEPPALRLVEPERPARGNGAPPRSRRAAEHSIEEAPAPAAGDDGDLLIFAAARSAWFTDYDTEEVAENDELNWGSDIGWRAAERASKPAIAEETSSGLPRRVPQQNLVPGSAAPPAAAASAERPLRIVRDAASIAAHTTGYFRGWRRGQEVGGYSVGGRPGRESASGWDFSRDGGGTGAREYEEREYEYRSARR